ncbi:acyltransferase family protein [Corallococcus macrosporus]|uniref:Acyltransferase n=1 Tax=Corallococcus macrosporus DSM 14697 TaxID=1189310 RepID=A0A250JPS8_9BACT|nr:acyltransferase [Corallococcus macrosporus]ATB45497.1 acyltransferase [Corallococcus macrosporus DSM 14697]
MSGSRALDALTGLRFVAALHVVLFHFAAPCLGTAPEALRNWVGAGYAAVGVFFVLSGFVLAWNYLDADGRMETSPRAFWAARVARVYPVYLLTFLLSAPTTIAPSVADNGWKVAAVKLAVGGAVTLALLQAWVPRLALYWNPPGWSVAVEACFYGLFPRLAKGLPRLKPAWLPVALAGTWGLGLAPPLLYLVLLPDGPGPVDVHASGPWLMALKFNPLARLPEFLIGVLLGWCFVRERAAGGGKGSGAVLAALGTALLVAAGAAGERVPYPLMHNALLAPASGLLVYGLARGGGALGWLLSRPTLVRLGGASYALYLLQYPVSEAAKGVGAALSPWVELRTPEGLLATVLVLGVPASLWVHRYVETPLRARVRAALAPWVEGPRREDAKSVVSGA